MKLSAAAKHFNKTIIADAYNSASTVLGKLDLSNESTRDSVASDRRVVYLAEGVSMPARRVIQIGAATYLVGASQQDVYKGDVLRHGYVLHDCEALADVCTIYELLHNSHHTQAWYSRIFNRNVRDEQRSNLQNVEHLFFSTAETIVIGDFIKVGTAIYSVKGIYVDAVGIQTIECLKCEDNALTTVNYLNNHAGFDPVTETNSTSPVLGITALVTRFNDDVIVLNQSDPKMERGDIRMRVFVGDLSDPQPGDNITLNSTGVLYKVVSRSDRGDSTWSVILREA